jgi:hypothetical protein
MYIHNIRTLTPTVSRVVGTPTLRKAQKVKAHFSLAFCTTMRFATLPTIVRFPARVLDAANASHDSGA